VAGLLLGFLQRLQYGLQPGIEGAVGQLAAHLVILDQIGTAQRTLVDLSGCLLRRHAHFGLDDLKDERTVISSQLIAQPLDAELGPIELLGHSLGDINVQHANPIAEGEDVARDGQQHHRDVYIFFPGRNRKGELDHGLLGPLRCRDFIISQDLARQSLTNLRGFLLHVHPTGG
jgi:hypothetical protein